MVDRYTSAEAAEMIELWRFRIFTNRYESTWHSNLGSKIATKARNLIQSVWYRAQRTLLITGGRVHPWWVV